jgi:hypothetical protein
MAQIGTTSLDELPLVNDNQEIQQPVSIQKENKTQMMEENMKRLEEQRKSLDTQINPRPPQQSLPPPQQTTTNQQLQQQQGFGVPINNVNEFVQGVQQAGMSGALQLPSRDIPQNTIEIQNDQQIKPNYIPQPQTQRDYITEQQSTDDIIRANAQKEKDMEFWDKLYSEISLPLLVFILYFLFQLPSVRKTIHNLFPFAYTSVGEMNIYGFILNSFMFGSILYSIHKLVKVLSV